MTNILKSIPLFSSLNDIELEAIQKLSYVKKYPRDQIILLEDEEGDSLFIIIKGKVKVVTYSETGKEVIFSILSDNDFFGDMSLLDGKPRSASIVTMTGTTIQMIRRPDFNRLLVDHPRIALGLLEVLAGRLRKADERIESLALLDVSGRIAGVLLQLADERGIIQDNQVLIKGRPTHQELANMVGTTRETVTRVLKQLENKSYITMSGKDVLILNTDSFKNDLYF